jgi:hypothetical protein
MYDARTKFPQCPSTRRIRDQCGCGSCFAFGALEAFEDRLCIHNGVNVTLSVEDMISCHTDENFSCDGGNPIAVWQNVLAGSSEGDGAISASCYPYEIKPCPCNHHSSSSTLPQCTPEGTGSTPTCDLMKKFDCEDKGVYKAEAPELIPAAAMEQELVENGPITVAYDVRPGRVEQLAISRSRPPADQEIDTSHLVAGLVRFPDLQVGRLREERGRHAAGRALGQGRRLRRRGRRQILDGRKLVE